MRSPWLRERTLEHLQAALRHWKPVRSAAPPGGWLRAIRLALGMTSRQLAERAGVRHTSVEAAQRAEVVQTISLATLQRYAAALDCRLIYAIVPKRGSLESMRNRRAEILVMERIWLGMSQVPAFGEELDFANKTLRRAALRGNPTKLWR